MLLQERSRALGTYALCGFCSLSTIAIALGVWEAICPQRKKHFKKMMMQVLMQANISCFTTACVAGQYPNQPFPFAVALSYLLIGLALKEK